MRCGYGKEKNQELLGLWATIGLKELSVKQTNEKPE
jgi:hypothetical protein